MNGPGGKASRGLRERDRKVLWHPFTQHNLWEKEDFPVIVEGEGAYLVDADGKRYLDGVSSLWLNVHGHRRPEIDRAITGQLAKIAHSTFLGQSHPPGIELAERLIRVAPPGLARVFFSDDGSTAMEIALKMAHQYRRQSNPEAADGIFIKFENAYHGDTVGSVSLGGIDLFHAAYRPLLFETVAAPAPYCLRCPPERKEGCEQGSGCIEDLERVLSDNQGRVTAVVIEPRMQGAAGMIVQPQGFLKAVRGLCDRYGALMVADEVATGFGRTTEMFACDSEGVTPDIMAVGKGLSGGCLPIAATLATEKVFDAFRGPDHSTNTFFHGHSYTANQLGCAAAIASLDLFKTDRTLEKVKKRAEEARAFLAEVSSLDHVAEVRQAGLMIGIELTDSPGRPYPPSAMTGREVILEARARGLIIRPLGDVVVLMPPLCVTGDQVARIIALARDSIIEVTEKRAAL